MHPTVVDRLATRDRARGLGDVNLEHACNADLTRFGYVEPVARAEFVAKLPDDIAANAIDFVASGVETTQPVQPLERAVPEPPKRGRKPLPRCEHNNILGRCVQCNGDNEGAQRV
jgi:hypothetical protein